MEEIRKFLPLQMTKPAQWHSVITNIHLDKGCNQFIECGAMRSQSAMVKFVLSSVLFKRPEQVLKEALTQLLEQNWLNANKGDEFEMKKTKRRKTNKMLPQVKNEWHCEFYNAHLSFDR